MDENDVLPAESRCQIAVETTKQTGIQTGAKARITCQNRVCNYKMRVEITYSLVMEMSDCH